MATRRQIPKSRNNCTVNTLSTSTGIGYALADSIADEAGRKPGRGMKSYALIEAAMKHGIVFHKVNMKSKTLRRFLRENPTGRFYCRKAHHAFSVVDGQLHKYEYGVRDGSIVRDAWRVVSVPTLP